MQFLSSLVKKEKWDVTWSSGFKNTLIFCVFLAVCVLYFRDILKGGVLFTERDLSIFFIPPRKLWTDMVKMGKIPLWNPYFSCGQPFFASLQPGVLYPLNLLLLFFPFDYTFNIIIILHFFMAGCFSYLLLKTLGATDTGAFIGGSIFMLSGYLLSVHNLLIHLLSVVWLPLVLLSYHKHLNYRKTRYLIYTSIFLVMMFLGGAIEILYGTFILLFILICFPDPFGTGVTPPTLKKRCRGLFFIVLLFILLSAVQLLPFLEMAFHSIRAGGLSYKEAVTWSLDLKDMIQFFIPDLYGYTHSTQKYWQNQSWLKTIYLGIIPFVLFLFFLTDKKRKALTLILIMELSLLLSFGGNTPLYRYLFLSLPFFNSIRYPVKFLFIFIFFLSMGAGLGYDSLCQQIMDRKKTAQVIIRGILIGSVCTVCAWSLISLYQGPVQAFMEAKRIAPPDYNFSIINIHNVKRFLLFCSLFGPVMAFGWRYVKKKRAFSLAVVSLLIIDLFFANRGYYQKYNAEEYYKPSETIQVIKKEESLFRAKTKPAVFLSPLEPDLHSQKKIEPSPFPRVATAPKTRKESIKYSGTFSDPIKVDKEKITPGFNLLHNIYNINGAEVIRLGNYEKINSLIMKSPRPDSTNLLSLLNVKYLISKHEMDSEDLELLEMVGNKEDPEGSLRIYKNLRCLPRAFLVEDFQVLRSEDEYKEILRSKEFYPDRIVLLDKAPFREAPDSGKTDTDEEGKDSLYVMIEEERVIISDYQPNRIELYTFSKRPKILFLSETYYPGWEVYIDGSQGEILRADFAFRAVALSPGHHKVEFVYRPMSVILGLFMTLFTICVILLSGIKNTSSPPGPHGCNEGIQK
ncbi:MAG: YfhO family protein [bacterium]